MNPIHLIDQTLTLLARALKRIRVSANMLTLTGLGFSALAGFFIVKSSFLIAATCIGLSGLCDLLDGRLARLSPDRSPFGALLDSALDRYSDAFFLGGMAVYFYQHIDTLYMWLAISAMVGSFEISYIRARSEGLGQNCQVGFWERGERTVLIALGLVADNLHLTVVYLGLLTHVTAYERIQYVRQKLDSCKDGQSKTTSQSNISKQRGTKIWWLQTLVLVLTLLIFRL